MRSKLVYVELKTGYNDDGPAWIGKGFFSKTGRTIYFNGHAFSRHSRSGGNHYEVLSGDYYWISGVKKKANDRHWAGGGKVKIDREVVDKYLEVTKFSTLSESNYEIVELNNTPPVKALNEFQNLEF